MVKVLKGLYHDADSVADFLSIMILSNDYMNGQYGIENLQKDLQRSTSGNACVSKLREQIGTLMCPLMDCSNGLFQTSKAAPVTALTTLLRASKALQMYNVSIH